MSSKGPTQTATQTTAPPAYLQPYLQQGLQGAANIYHAGQQAVPLSQDTLQALNMTRDRALQGSPVTQAANQYALQVLQGGFMGQNPILQGGVNPHLDATFNQAAQATQNQLTSEFARAGRNLGAREPFRAEQLNNLATSIYGGAYDADQSRRLAAYQGERGLQQGLVPLAGLLGQQDYLDASRLAGVGGAFEDYQQRLLNQPQMNLDAYLTRLQGFPGSVVTQSVPTSRNPLAGALGGSELGSMLGPWGMLGGAILGGLYG